MIFVSIETKFRNKIFNIHADFPDDVVDSMSKLIHTPKTLGIIYQESDFLTQAPDHSLLYKLSKKRVHFFGIRAMEEASAIIKSLPSYAFFSREVSLLFIFSVFVKLSDTKLVAFLATRSYHEALASFYIRRGLDEERKRFIHFRAESSFEKGRYKPTCKLLPTTPSF